MIMARFGGKGRGAAASKYYIQPMGPCHVRCAAAGDVIHKFGICSICAVRMVRRLPETNKDEWPGAQYDQGDRDDRGECGALLKMSIKMRVIFIKIYEQEARNHRRGGFVWRAAPPLLNERIRVDMMCPLASLQMDGGVGRCL